jgi:hypothetical protein
MDREFLDAFTTHAGLTSREREVLDHADVRSAADVHSLIKSFPSIGKLGVRLDTLSQAASRDLSAPFVEAAAASAQQPQTFGFGATPPPGLAPQFGTVVTAAAMPAAPAAPPTQAIDLRLDNWSVRDQGGRDSCVAFATAACVEQLRAPLGGASDLSEQFLHWAIKDHTDPNQSVESTRLDFARTALATDGICAEALCRYRDSSFGHPWGSDPGQPVKDAARATALLPAPIA